MSQVLFTEILSADPVERALARKVMDILNDPALDRQGREDKVHQVQRELLRHRRQKQTRQALTERVVHTQMPKGYQARCITVREGVVHVGAVDRRQGFVWIEAGTAPTGVAANQPTFAIERPKASKQRVRKDSIAERRKAMTQRQT